MTLTIRRTQFTGNTAATDGGGIYVEDTGGLLTIEDSTISGNQSSADGGGIYFYDPDADVLISRTTISGNTAVGKGGGIHLYSMDAGVFTIENSTISGNSAANGGGVYLYKVDLEAVIRNTTIANNTATVSGGGLIINRSPGSSGANGFLDITNTILANNTAGGSPNDLRKVTGTDFWGNVTNSLIEAMAAGTLDNAQSTANNILAQDPVLGALANNGGLTQTHALLDGSPALGAGVASLVTTDQRGQARQSPPDIGAFELNLAPVLAAAGNITYTENDPATAIDSGITVADVDDATLASASITITNFVAGQDVLSFTNVPATMGNIAVNTNASGVLTLTSAGATATKAQWQAALRAVRYTNTSENPNITTRSVDFVVNDGTSNSTALTSTINITSVLDKASILGFDTAVNFTEGDAATLLDTDTTVTDLDSANFNGGSLTVFLNDALELSDRLAISHQGTNAGEIGISGANVSFGGTQIGTFGGGTGVAPLVISFNANATPNAVQALVRRLTYRNIAENSSGAQRVVRLALNDGGGTLRAVHKRINVITVNDAPVIGAFDTMINYIDNTAAVQLDFNATVVDVDSDNLNTGTLTATLTAGSQSTDRLEIRHVGNGINQIGVSGTNVTYQGTVVGTFTGGSGSTPLVVTFNASSSPIAAYYLLRNITFRSLAAVPSTAPRTVQVSLTDGDGGTSNMPTKTITVTAVNDAATISGFGPAITYTEGNAPVLLDTDVTITDADSTNFDTGSMTVYLNAVAEAADRLAIRHEGTAAGQIGISGANVTFGGVTIGAYTGGTGVTPLVINFNANATPAAAQALARNLTYSNVSTTPSTVQRTVRISLNDGDGATRLVSKLINVVATP